MHKTFQNQEKMDVFKEIYDCQLHVKLDHPQRTTKRIIQVQGIVELSRQVEHHF